MENVFDGLISKLVMAEERLSELEYLAIETSKIERQTEKNTEKQNNIQELWDNYKRKEKKEEVSVAITK